MQKETLLTKKKININNALLPVAAILLCIIFQSGNSNFFTIKNWTNIGRQQAALLIAAVGQTFVVLTGCIDLSIGSMVGFISVVTADVAIRSGFPAALAVAIGIGIVVGVCQGFLVAKINIPAFIVGLGFMNILRGAAYLYCNGMPISGLPQIYSDLGANSFMGLPIPLLVAIVFMFIGWAVLRIELYGHGKSGGTFYEHTVLKWMSEMMTVIDYARKLDFVSSLYLAGHSQGGFVTAMAGAMKEDVLKAILLLSPALMIPEDSRKGYVLGTTFDPDHIPDTVLMDGGRLLSGTENKLGMKKD